MAAGARLGDDLGRDVVVAEHVDLDAWPLGRECRRNPVDLTAVGAPDHNLAFLLGALV